MKQMIEKKNKMLKEAGEKFREIWKIYRMLDTIEVDSAHYKTLIKLINARLGDLSCRYGDYFEESDLYLPEAEEDNDPFLLLPEEEPTEEEMAASREVNGDD